MARYYEGVNGSMQGTAGGVNVYNWRGVWLQRSRRKEILNFVPTAKQDIVIRNFSALSRFIKPFAPIFKAGFQNAPAGQTARSMGAKYNYTRAKQGASHGGLIVFNYSDVVCSAGNYGGKGVSFQSPRAGEYSITWTPPTAGQPAYDTMLYVMALNTDNKDSVIFSFDSSAGLATLDLSAIYTGEDLYFYYFFANGGGSTVTGHIEI